MRRGETSFCKEPTCRAQLLWVESANTRSVFPVNATPDPKGTLAVVDGWQYSASSLAEKLADKFGISFELAEMRAKDYPRHVPHHATCPAADTFRRRPRARSPR